jgi:hypothetical protein
MSIVQACADAEAQVARVRSLFGDGAAAPGEVTDLASAVHTAKTARAAITPLSGSGVDGYQSVVERSLPALSTGAGSDTTLAGHLGTAAAATRAGAIRIDDIAARVQAIARVAPAARSAADQRVVLTALRSQLSEASQVVQAGQQQASGIASEVKSLKYPKDSPQSPGGGVQAVDYDVPLSPPPADPPHGKDPRYWIDVTKIIHVAPGQLAPAGYKQIGPGLWYPSDVDRQQYNVTPPPDAVKYPLDMSTIEQKGPGQLGPYGTTELAPGYFAPTPNTLNPQPPWSPPQRPIDIRDIIEVPKGTLAPWGYVEYLPGWWAPDPSRGGPS